MKKLIAGLFAAILTTAGLVAVSSAPAQAACQKGYACVKTSTKVSSNGSIRRGQRATITITLSAKGNIAPKGTYTVRFVGAGAGAKQTIKVSRAGKFTARSGVAKRKGKIRAIVSFKGAKYVGNSSGGAKINVRR
ncbi:hypothetical protein GHK92_19840 [Nocardioides sp. dk4132]|uniref:hypothetical protein n=1 Tax=unclassified Nocardioides TaxID=2615069 RepID=UPI0012974A44|nr:MULTISPECIES: hypothetical protein [unclassified Nocardioides]MQW78124.1 hypothetical protein [Nocardioides sp. dk4132]QGA09054.1 hypothetical protein GFH29_17865 [Nocardioides sp. dk884]